MTWFLSLLLSASVHAQSVNGNYVRLYPRTIPSVCNIGDLATDVSTGTLKFCSATNTWSSLYAGALPIAVNNGGTGSDLSATGGAHDVLEQISTGAAITVGRLACSDLSNAAASCATDATNASNITSGLMSIARLNAGNGTNQVLASTTGLGNFWTTAPTLGTNGTAGGSLAIEGATSGTITIQPQAAAGTYNWNLPTSAGSSGQFLTSGGGGSSPMLWYTFTGDLTVSGGGIATVGAIQGVPVLAGTPNSGQVLTYNGTSSKWDAEAGGSGVGGTNNQTEYITNGKAETDTSGWATYANTAQSTPVTGTGGSPTVAFSRDTTASHIIRGVASFEITNPGLNYQGQGVSYDFTVDPQDYKNGQPVWTSFEYKETGAFASGDVQCFVYDKDAGSLITVMDTASLNCALQSSTNGTKMVARFYPTTATSSHYRLIFHIATTNASAYSVIFDSVHVGNNPVVPGAIMTDPVAYTPTFTGFGTVTGVNVRSQRIGSNLRVWGFFTAGTPTATGGQITVGYNGVNANVTPTNDGGAVLGYWNANGGTAGSTTGGFYYPSGNTIGFTGTSGSNSYIAINGSVIVGTGSGVGFEFMVPISGWTSSTALSTTEALFQNVKATYTFAGTATTVPNSTTETISSTYATYTQIKDTNNAFSNGVFTFPVSGSFHACLKAGLQPTTSNNGVLQVCLQQAGSSSKSSCSNSGLSTPGAGVNISSEACGDFEAVKGDTLTLQVWQNNSTNAIALSSSNAINEFSIAQKPNLSVFSVYGPFEIQTVTSSVKTPTASGNWQSMTGNSLTLSPGTWRLLGNCNFSNSGSAPPYQDIACDFRSANGADSSTGPAALSSGSGITVLTSGSNSEYNPTSANLNNLNMPAISTVIRCSSSCTVYLDTFAIMTTAANARVSVSFNAERLQ